jgi:hypothetical protein
VAGVVYDETDVVQDLDLAYRELSKVSYSTLARPVPDWFYDDVKDAVFTQSFPKLSSRFVETPFL